MGKFISFEGGEASGKTTQIIRLQHRLAAQGFAEVLCLREPGGTPLGEKIRHLLQFDPDGQAMTSMTELLLFAASRAQLTETVIAPALARGAWVLCDRFIDSTRVYQGVARQLGIERVGQVNALAVGTHRPQLTFILDVPIELAFARLRDREQHTPQDRLESEPHTFHETVRRAYQELAAEEPSRVVLLDASQTPEQVFDQVWTVVQARFGV
ncbi:MAG: dTMP kinase [Verrucomicrobiales bacterium]